MMNWERRGCREGGRWEVGVGAGTGGGWRTVGGGYFRAGRVHSACHTTLDSGPTWSSVAKTTRVSFLLPVSTSVGGWVGA